MNKTKIKLLVPYLSGKGPVWEEYVLKLAEEDDRQWWSKTVSTLPTLPPLQSNIIKRSLIKRLPSLLI